MPSCPDEAAQLLSAELRKYREMVKRAGAATNNLITIERPSMPRKHFDPKDVEVGRRVRAFRLNKGLSQEELDDELGITFQQVQK